VPVRARFYTWALPPRCKIAGAAPAPPTGVPNPSMNVSISPEVDAFALRARAREAGPWCAPPDDGNLMALGSDFRSWG